jgi:hypothetical protein
MENNKIVSLANLSRYHENIQEVISAEVNKLMSDTEIKFFCIEPVTLVINEERYEYPANTLVDKFINTSDSFELITTSESSISALYAWPGALNTYYTWLEGVNIFDGILFDMNTEDMYTKWNQGNQGLYHVQFAQYKNCIFWSDLAYISDVAKRTNYTLYYSSELPLCYSTIPDNTFKSFYFAYNVTCDPNWSNPAYKESFAKATWATQVFSYYGLHSIGLFDMDSSRFNITLPKDCRGLMFYAPNILNAGVFDAINVTNFGAKSGSWRDAFAYCYQLSNLYIKNLKVNLNVSWSPINQQSLEFILSNAANTNKITIYLSPHTYYGLTEANKTLATEKNITLSLIATNTTEDNRLAMLQRAGDGNSFLANDGTYKVISISTNLSNFNNDAGFITEIPDEYVTQDNLTTEVNTAVSNIIDSAPETLNTLGKLATAFKDNEDVISVLNSAIGNKSDVGHTHDERYYTKAEVDELLSNQVSLEVVQQMIADNNANCHVYCTNDDILSLFDASIPEEPVEPDTPVEPEVPTESIGSISEDNSIVIDETQLENGIYTLRYIDTNENIIDNFNEITSFEINN